MSNKKKTKAVVHQLQPEKQIQKRAKQDERIAQPSQDEFGYFTADRSAPLGHSIDSSVNILRSIDMGKRHEMLGRLGKLQGNAHTERVVQRLRASESAEQPAGVTSLFDSDVSDDWAVGGFQEMGNVSLPPTALPPNGDSSETNGHGSIQRSATPWWRSGQTPHQFLPPTPGNLPRIEAGRKADQAQRAADGRTLLQRSRQKQADQAAARTSDSFYTSMLQRTMSEFGMQIGESGQLISPVSDMEAARSAPSDSTVQRNNGAHASTTDRSAPSPNNAPTPQIQTKRAAPIIQTKLTVNEVNDPFEQEADRVADEVMRMQATDVAPPPADAPPETPPDENNNQKGKDRVQRSAENDPMGGATVDSDVESRVSSLEGRGEPLSESSQEFFGSRMGADFSDVRIHRDASSAELSTDLNARAFTVGNNIAFNSGEYNPDTPDGKRLLAHELTHTVQQGASSQLSRKEAAQIEAEARAEANLKQFGEKANSSEEEPNATASPESVGPSSAQEELAAAAKPPVQPTDLNKVQGEEASGGEEGPQREDSGGDGPDVEEAEELDVEGEDVDIELPPEAATIVAEAGVTATSADEAAASESVGGEAIPTADGGGTLPELPPSPPVPEVASAEPAQAITAVSSLMPVDLLQGIGKVAGSVGTFVKSKEDELAANPPQMERPSGAEAKREQPGNPVQLPDAPPPIPVQKTPEGADVPAPQPKPEPVAPPPAARNAPAPSSPDDVESAVSNIPTADAGVNTDPGEPPKVVADGNADPTQIGDQATKLYDSAGKTFATGQKEAQLPMGEREVYPVVPPETLKAVLPEGGDAAAAVASAEAAVADAANFEDPDAISIIAQEEQGAEIEAALASAQTEITAQQTDHETAIQAEQDKSRQEIDQIVTANKAEQDELRAQTLGEVEGMRTEWSAEQTQLVTDAQQESMQLQQSGQAEIQQQFTEANAEASQHIDEGRQKAEAAQQEGEQKAEAKKAEGESESSGFFGKLFSAAADFFDKVKKAVTSVLEAAQKAIKAAIDIAKKLATAVIEAARKAIVSVIQRVGDALIAIGDKLLAAFPELNEKFKTLIQDTVDRATQAVNELADKLKENVQKALDALAEGLSAALNLLQQGLMFVIDSVHNAVKGAIDAAKAIVDTLGTFAALITDIAANPGQWLSNLGAAIKDGIVNHLWSAFQTKVKEWFNSKLEEVLGLGATVWNVLKEGGFDIAKIGKMAWDALVDAIPSALMQILIEKLVSMIVPVAGAIMVIIEGLQAAWGTVQRIIQAIDAFVNFLKLVKSGGAGPAFANVLATAAIVVIDFVSNWLLAKLKSAGKAVAGKLKKMAKKLFGKGKKKKKKKKDKNKDDDKNKQAKVRKGLAAIDSQEKRYMEDGGIKKENAQKVAKNVKSQHPVFKSIRVVDGKERWDYNYTIARKLKVGEEKFELAGVEFTGNEILIMIRGIAETLTSHPRVKAAKSKVDEQGDHKNLRGDKESDASEMLVGAASHYHEGKDAKLGSFYGQGGTDTRITMGNAENNVAPIDMRQRKTHSGVIVDHLPDGGTYADVNSKLANFNMTDKEIAESLLSVTQSGELPSHLSPKAKTELTKSAWLIFGTESARNPANLVSAKMTMDLVASGNMTMNEALNDPNLTNRGGGGQLPMSPAGAVKGARDLEKNVEEERGKEPSYGLRKSGKADSYNEKGNQQLEAEEVAQREIAVVKKWAAAKLTPEWAEKNLPKNIDDKSKAKRLIHKEIEKRMVEYYIRQ